MIARLDQTSTETSRLLRRLDWRFLLPDPQLRRVIHVGPHTSTLARALNTYSESTDLAAREADLVVGESVTRRELEAALARLGPGGWLYWELRPGHTIRSADRDLLGRFGIEQIQTFWNYGGFENHRWLVPLDQPDAFAMMLKRRFPGVPLEALRGIAGRLIHSQTICRALPTSVIGHRGPWGVATPFAQRFIEARGVRQEPAMKTGTRPYVVVTPTFPSSRSVVFLMNPDASCEPTLVAKVARSEGDGAPLACEARNLRAVHRAHAGVAAPRLMAHGVFERRAILVESALRGGLIQPRRVRQQPACLEAVLSWLGEFHRTTRAPAGHLPGSVRERVNTQFKRLEAVVACEPGAPELLLRVRRATNQLDALDVPLVFEHGDLSSPNLLIDERGNIGVLDWELSDARGLPATDLFFFLAFIAFARARATAPDQWIARFHQAFFGRDAWATPYIVRYCEAVGVPRRALVPLFLICWSRYLSLLPGRMAWATGRQPGPDEVCKLRNDRYWHLWKYAAEHMDDLHFES